MSLLPRAAALTLALAATTFALPASAAWTFSNDNGGDGTLVGAVPAFTILGADNGVDDGFADIAAYVQRFDAGQAVTFDWRYATFDDAGAAFDPAGYLLDGVLHPLSSDADVGVGDLHRTTVVVAAGQTFGWYVSTIDAEFGRGELDVQVLPVPEPSTPAMWALGLAALAAAWRRRHRTPGSASTPARA